MKLVESKQQVLFDRRPKFLKKEKGNPSRPGAFPDGSPNTAAFSSSSANERSR
jgi:hypothetical protein